MTDQVSPHNMQSTQGITEKSSSNPEGSVLHLQNTTETPRKGPERARSERTLEADKPAANVVPRSMAFKQIVGASVMLLVLFWANTSWILGKIYKQVDYAHRLHVLAVDLDGGVIGQSLLDTAGLLSGTVGEPTYVPITYSENETFDSTYSRVRKGGKVWGAIIANPRASNNLTAALSPSSNSSYNASSALTFIYNEARYRTVEMSLIYSTMLRLTSTVTANYQRTHGVATILGLGSNATAENVAVALQPIGYSVVYIKAFAFSSSVLLNTVMFVFPALSQFFFVVAVNGILGGVGAYSNWSLKSNLVFRAIIGTAFPCLIGLSWAGWVFIWKDDGNLSAGQYFLSWLAIWLYASINFHLLDGTCSLLEMRWMPFVVFTLIITQVSAVLSPMELASNFYRIEYVLPSHHIWGILITIFGNGATNNLKVNLTVAILWLLVAATFGLFANYTRWKKATATTVPPASH